jgi:hypothetical protein
VTCCFAVMSCMILETPGCFCFSQRDTPVRAVALLDSSKKFSKSVESGRTSCRVRRIGVGSSNWILSWAYCRIRGSLGSIFGIKFMREKSMAECVGPYDVVGLDGVWAESAAFLCRVFREKSVAAC